MHNSFIRRTLSVLGLVALLGLIVYALAGATRVFLLTFVAVLVGVLLHSVSKQLSKRTPLPHSVSLALTILLIAGLLAGFGAFAGPQLSEQLTGLVDSLPDALARLEQTLSRFTWGEVLLSRLPDLSAITNPGSETLGGMDEGVITTLAGRLSQLLSGLIATLGDIFFVFLTGVFFAASAPVYTGGIKLLVPKSWRGEVESTLHHVYRTLQGWLFGQFVAMLTIGTLVGVSALILGVPFALGLGFLAFIFEFIPTVGPWLAGVPAVLMALSVSPSTALWMIGIFILIELLEGNLILPLIHQRTVEMPPALSLFAIFLMGSLFGLLGILVAAPLAAVILTLVKILYVKKKLGDEVTLPGDA